jgi:hypothetical protein
VRAHHEERGIALGNEGERFAHERRLFGAAHRRIRARRRICWLGRTTSLRVDDREMTRATHLSALRVAREVAGHDVEPRIRGAGRLVDETDECLLREIFGEVAIAEPRVEIPYQAGVVAFEELANVHAVSFFPGNSERCSGATCIRTSTAGDLRQS